MKKLELLRFFELSWLDLAGCPQLAILEIALADNKTELDSKALKTILNDLVMLRFRDLDAVKAALVEMFDLQFFLNPAIELHVPEDYQLTQLSLGSQSFVDEPVYQHPIHLSAASGDFYLFIDHFRFLCKNSNQPYIGHVWVKCVDGQYDSQILTKLIATFRDEKYLPSEILQPLYLACLEAFSSKDLIVSMHLARRGGISHQSLITEMENIDLSHYACRLAVE